MATNTRMIFKQVNPTPSEAYGMDSKPRPHSQQSYQQSYSPNQQTFRPPPPQQIPSRKSSPNQGRPYAGPGNANSQNSLNSGRSSNHGSGSVSSQPSGQSGAMPYLPPQGTDVQRLERQLHDLFNKVDINRTGVLSEYELSNALLNNDYSRFNSDTVRLMIKLFDKDGTGSIGFREFYHLWNYIAYWRRIFQQFDSNNSKTISFQEYSHALESFGYHISTDTVLYIFQKFSQYRQGAQPSMQFDMFVESLVWLLRCTNSFKKYDTRGTGIGTIPFQDFVMEVMNFR